MSEELFELEESDELDELELEDSDEPFEPEELDELELEDSDEPEVLLELVLSPVVEGMSDFLLGMPRSIRSLTVTNLYPFSTSLGKALRRACTVWLRSPPPSCMRTT